MIFTVSQCYINCED